MYCIKGNIMNSRQDEFLERIKKTILMRMDPSRESPDEEVKRLIEQVLEEENQKKYFSFKQRAVWEKELFHSFRGMDILQELLDDEEVTEIMINGPGCIFYEKGGQLYQWDKQFSSEDRLSDIVQQIASGANRMVNEASPIVDARLKDGARVNIVLMPAALNGPAVTIRRFPKNPITMKDLLKLGTLHQEAAEFLNKLVIAGYNIFISGGTGSGKTTFLNVLSEYIPKEQRIITIEDSAELQIQNAPNLVRLETRNANVEGCIPITIRDLIKTSLRMRPDRIIVGEVRGEEALDLLQAMNTGHDGSISTGHANSTADMLSRLETMVLMNKGLPIEAVRRQIASGIDIMIHLGRLRDKSRKVLEISEVTGYEKGEICLQTLYAFEEKGEEECGRVLGELQKKNRLLHKEKLYTSGVERKTKM